jgi:putative peptide zinc metalloprotease protein
VSRRLTGPLPAAALTARRRAGGSKDERVHMAVTAGHDGHPAGAAPQGAGVLQPAPGLQLLGEYQGSGFTEPRYLVRRGDGQVIQLSRLLYLVLAAIADGSADGGWDAGRVAARVSSVAGRAVTAGNIGYLLAGKLAPLGLVPDDERTQEPPAGAARRPARAVSPSPLPRVNLLLGLRIRGVLLRPRAAGAAGGALAWLHSRVLVAAVLAGFAAFEAWLFGVHGVIGPLLAVLGQPVLFITVAGLTLASLVFHEFGHASACRYGGARPGVIGFGLYLVWPALYTDVTDAYRLDRAGRLRTDLGGVYFNAIFILALAGCYAATRQPVFLAAAFFGNIEILQQLIPVVRMDGYFILADLAGIPDLLGLILPVMASLLPRAAARRAGTRASGLRRGPRVIITTWVLLAVPLIAAVAGYTLWRLPVLAVTAARSFTAAVAAIRAGFSAGHPAAGLAGLLTVVLLGISAAGLGYLLAMVTARGLAAAIRLTGRLLPRLPRAAAVAGIAVLAAAGLAAALLVAPSGPPGHPAAAPPGTPAQQPGTISPAGPRPAPSATRQRPRTAAPLPSGTSRASRISTSAPDVTATWPTVARGPQPTTTPGLPSATPRTPGVVPSRSTPAPPRTTSPAPPRTPAPGGKPAPSPSCVLRVGISLLKVRLLCG